jgi:hypothetical protein
MAEEVQVPAIGKVDRKWVFAGLAAVGGIVVYAWWRRGQNAAVAPVPGEGDVVPADIGASGTDAFSGATSPGGAGFDEPTIDTTPNTNAEWSQRVIDLLEGAGFDRTFAATTIGKYLSGQPLALSEKLLVQTAIALLGNPPAGALPIISAPETPTTTTPPTTTVKHKYVIQVHQIAASEAVRHLVQRFSSTNSAVSTPNNIETATRRTQADPRNVGDLKLTSSGWTALKQHSIYVTTVQAA